MRVRKDRRGEEREGKRGMGKAFGSGEEKEKEKTGEEDYFFGY